MCEQEPPHFHFKICYPDIDGGFYGRHCNEWTQSTNPASDDRTGEAAGFQAIVTAFPVHSNDRHKGGWAGLGKSYNPNILISASPQGYSRFGIGAFANLNPDKTTNRKISGPMALDAKKVELYVCPADKICRAGGMYAHYFVVVYSVNPYL